MNLVKVLLADAARSVPTMLSLNYKLFAVHDVDTLDWGREAATGEVIDFSFQFSVFRFYDAGGIVLLHRESKRGTAISGGLGCHPIAQLAVDIVQVAQAVCRIAQHQNTAVVLHYESGGSGKVYCRHMGIIGDVATQSLVLAKSKVLDLDGDGKSDAVTVDLDHDGRIDAVAIDTDDDGKADKLIVDVRNNPGGYAHELVDVLDHLLPEGELFRTEDYTGKQAVEKSDADCLQLPMAVLVNGNSYSAAEFFAAALSEYEWAEVVGEKTTGKGYYQVTYQFSDGSAVGLSVGKYYTPKGVSLAGVGITPDVLVPVDQETANAIYAQTLEPEKDPQIQAAVKKLLEGE